MAVEVTDCSESYLLQIARQVEQDRDTGSHLKQSHNEQCAKQYRSVRGLRLQAVLPGLRVHGVPQVASVLAVGSCHDAGLRVLQPKVRDPTLDVRAGNGAFTGTPEAAGGWAEPARCSLTANHGESLRDTGTTWTRTGTTWTRTEMRAATGKERTRDSPPTQHARAHLLALPVGSRHAAGEIK